MSLKERFERNGFVVVEDVFSAEEVDRMKIEMERLVEDIDLSEHSKSIFTTYDEDKHTADDYFLNSSDKIRVFFEEGALDKEGNLTVPKKKALNKVGHGLHWLNPLFRQTTFHDKMKDLFRQLNFEQPKIVQSMYIFKCLPSSTVSCVLIIYKRKLPCSVSLEKNLSMINRNLFKFLLKKVCVSIFGLFLVYSDICCLGSLILIHGLVVHKSERNTSTKSRHAYTFHVMEKKGTLWSTDNW
uniref:Phytanoyl-CoA dioxygenase n=1 Tax=Heterorhabditis bacteriophora TaxID=37862 RepID=A0A1I7WMY2_HETBA